MGQGRIPSSLDPVHHFWLLLQTIRNAEASFVEAKSIRESR